jgi:hypothetical protein
MLLQAIHDGGWVFWPDFSAAAIGGEKADRCHLLGKQGS